MTEDCFEHRVDRNEVVLGLVAEYVPVRSTWRLLVCHELQQAHTPHPASLRMALVLSRLLRAWQLAVRRPPRRHNSWRRRLHHMDDPVMAWC